MKSGEQEERKIGRNFDINASDKLIEDDSVKPMVYSTSKMDGGGSSSTVHGDDHHSNTSSRLAMVVFFILLIMISIGVYLLFVNWPKISDPSDNRSATLAKALLTWYEEEVAADSHHHDDHDHDGESTTGHPTTDHHHHEDEHEEEKFYWEETWPEPTGDDEEDDGHGKDHGSGENEVKQSTTISEDDQHPSLDDDENGNQINLDQEDAHQSKDTLKKLTSTIKSNQGNQPNDLESQVNGDNNNHSDDEDDDVDNASNDVVKG